MGDWARLEKEIGSEITETENTELFTSDIGNNTVEFRLLDE